VTSLKLIIVVLLSFFRYRAQIGSNNWPLIRPHHVPKEMSHWAMYVFSDILSTKAPQSL